MKIGRYDDFESEKFLQMQVVWVAVRERLTRKPTPDYSEAERIKKIYLELASKKKAPESNVAVDNWNVFWDFMTSKLFNIKKIRSTYPWQIWLSDGEHNFRTGIKGNISTTLSPDKAGTIHNYHGIPSDAIIDLKPYMQNGRRYYLGTAKIELLDAICSVPAIPVEVDAVKSAMRALDDKMLPNEWQRMMNEKRVMQIRSWSESADDQMLINSIILYIPPQAFKRGVSLTQSGKLTIDFSKFLTPVPPKKEGIFSDWKSMKDRQTREEKLVDRRPIWLLDGQHRTRGMGISKRGSKLNVPITILSSSGKGPVTTSQAAKIFTEINTQAVDLDTKLQLFLANRFKTTGLEAMDFGDPNEAGISDRKKEYRRANRLSYHLAAWLSGASIEGDALFGSVHILPDNSKEKTHTTIEQWMEKTRGWFLHKSTLYPPEGDLSIEEIFNEVDSYFEAWKNTCNHNEWSNNPHILRWDSRRGRDQSYWEGDVPFRGLLYIFENLVPWMEENEEKEYHRPFQSEDFEQVLKPLKNLDWLDKNFKNSFSKGSEIYWKYFAPWCMLAIKSEEEVSEEDVMSTDSSQSHKPPRSVLSKPHKVFPEKEDLPLSWPRPNRASQIIVKRPVNSFTGESNLIGNISAVTNDGVKLKIECKTVSISDEIVIKVDHDPRISDSKSITVSIELGNPNGLTDNVFVIEKEKSVKNEQEDE